MSLELVVRMKFGSHLYGTASEDSDTDYKGIYMPTAEQVLLGKIGKSIVNKTKKGNEEKNTADDVDEELYSLHYFIALACEGQTVALDMLHAPDYMLTHSSELWQDLRKNRSKFYTKNLKSFIGYARKQASKYGIKGSRLAEAKMVLEAFEKVHPGTRIGEIWDTLPTGEHVYKMPPDTRTEKVYRVCDKMMIDTAKVGHYIPVLKTFIEEYGSRAKLAEQNQGVDWKAISHAFRAAFQVKLILTEGGFEYPLKEAPLLKDIKQGKVPYLQAAEQLENLIEEVQRLSTESPLPSRVDQNFWNRWLMDAILKEVL